MSEDRSSKVLIVEDEAIVAADLAAKLTRLGYEIVGIAESGEMAIEMASTYPFDVAFMDIRLAGSMDGIDAAKIIHSLHEAPIIYMTAHSGHATQDCALLTGPDAYTLKTFDDRELQTSIEKALYRHHVDRELSESREDLRHAQAVAHVGSWRLDTRRGTLRWSEETYRIFGLPPDTPLTFDSFLDIVHQDDRDRVKESWAAALRGEPYDIEHRIVVGDTVKWVRERAELEFDKKGNCVSGFGTSQDITDKKRREEDLLRARKEWERTFDSVSDLIAILDINHRIVQVNKAFARKIDRTPSECVGAACFEIIHGTDAPPHYCPHMQTMKDKQDHSVEIKGLYPDGEYLISVSPMEDADGQIIGTVHVARDVTEQKEMQLREKETAVRMARGQSAIDTINALHEGVLLLDFDGTITSVNPAVENLTGFKSSQIVGRALISMLPAVLEGDDLHRTRQWLQTLEEGCIPHLQSLRMRRRDGKNFHVLPGMSFMDGPEGGRKVAVLTLKDMTGLHEAWKLIEQSERKYRELVNNANSMIMRITPEHVITFFNEYALSFFGFSEEEILGKSVLDTILPPVSSNGVDHRKMIRAITAHPDEHANNENENICKDGRRVWVHWANRAVRNKIGAIQEILCVGTDITERKRVQAQNHYYQKRLRRLAEQLAASEERNRWQISRYIHDTIIQNLSLASMRMDNLRKPLASAELEHAVEDLKTTRKLVDEAITECRTVMNDLTPALLYELGLVPALAELAHSLQTQHGVQIRVEGDGRPSSIDKEIRALLFQSTREMVMNALKYAKASMIHITVTGEADGVIIRVEDDGIGFDLTKLEPHDTLPSGFGLFSVHERLDSLGGRLNITSAPGQGTAVTISLPHWIS